MKLRSVKYAISTLLAVVGAFAAASCIHCPDCKQTVYCAGPSTSDGDHAQGGEGPTDPVALVSDTQCSSTYQSKCLGGAAPSPYKCMQYAGCDTTQNPPLCMLKQAANTSCAEGSMRNCVVKATLKRGVAFCDPTTCDWPGDAGCQACGDLNQPCCVGGCVAGRICKRPLPDQTVDPTNKPGSSCQ